MAVAASSCWLIPIQITHVDFVQILIRWVPLDKPLQGQLFALVKKVVQGVMNQYHRRNLQHPWLRRPRHDDPAWAHWIFSPNVHSLRIYGCMPSLNVYVSFTCLSLASLRFPNGCADKKRSLISSPSGRLEAWPNQQSRLWTSCSRIQVNQRPNSTVGTRSLYLTFVVEVGKRPSIGLLTSLFTRCF